MISFLFHFCSSAGIIALGDGEENHVRFHDYPLTLLYDAGLNTIYPLQTGSQISSYMFSFRSVKFLVTPGRKDHNRTKAMYFLCMMKFYITENGLGEALKGYDAKGQSFQKYSVICSR